MTLLHIWTLREQSYLPPTALSCGWAPAVLLCERRSDPPGLLLGRLDIGTSLLKGHTLSRHYHSLKDKRRRAIRYVTWGLTAMPPRGKPKTLLFKQNLKTKTFQQFLVKRHKDKVLLKNIQNLNTEQSGFGIYSMQMIYWTKWPLEIPSNPNYKLFYDFVMTHFFSSRLL